MCGGGGVGCGGGGGGVLGEVKTRPKDIISSSLDYISKELSTDKQSIIKPHFTRHAGKAGGFVRCTDEGDCICIARGSPDMCLSCKLERQRMETKLKVLESA